MRRVTSFCVLVATILLLVHGARSEHDFCDNARDIPNIVEKDEAKYKQQIYMMTEIPSNCSYKTPIVENVFEESDSPLGNDLDLTSTNINKPLTSTRNIRKLRRKVNNRRSAVHERSSRSVSTIRIERRIRNLGTQTRRMTNIRNQRRSRILNRDSKRISNVRYEKRIRNIEQGRRRVSTVRNERRMREIGQDIRRTPNIRSQRRTRNIERDTRRSSTTRNHRRTRNIERDTRRRSTIRNQRRIHKFERDQRRITTLRNQRRRINTFERDTRRNSHRQINRQRDSKIRQTQSPNRRLNVERRLADVRGMRHVTSRDSSRRDIRRRRLQNRRGVQRIDKNTRRVTSQRLRIIYSASIRGRARYSNRRRIQATREQRISNNNLERTTDSESNVSSQESGIYKAPGSNQRNIRVSTTRVTSRNTSRRTEVNRKGRRTTRQTEAARSSIRTARITNRSLRSRRAQRETRVSRRTVSRRQFRTVNEANDNTYDGQLHINNDSRNIRQTRLRMSRNRRLSRGRNLELTTSVRETRRSRQWNGRRTFRERSFVLNTQPHDISVMQDTNNPSRASDDGVLKTDFDLMQYGLNIHFYLFTAMESKGNEFGASQYNNEFRWNETLTISKHNHIELNHAHRSELQSKDISAPMGMVGGVMFGLLSIMGTVMPSSVQSFSKAVHVSPLRGLTSLSL